MRLLKAKILMTSFLVISVVTILVGIYIGYVLFGKETVAKTEGEIVEATNQELIEAKTVVNVENVAFGESKQISKLFGYENDDFEFLYTADETPEAVRKSENDNIFENMYKATGRAFVGKTYEIKMESFLMFGYDMTQVTNESFVFDEESGVLTIYSPRLEMVFVPQFESTEFESFVGMLRKFFDEDKRKAIIADAINQGSMKALETKSEVELGHQMTEKALRKLYLQNEDIKENVTEIEFVRNEQKPKLTTQEDTNNLNNTKGENNNVQ